MPRIQGWIEEVDDDAPGHDLPGQPIFHPGHPDHGLPSGGHPSGQPLPPGGRPSKPGSPGHPGNRPPGSFPGQGSGTLPVPPPGVWPPPSQNHPWVPIPPDKPAEPGAIWPPLHDEVSGMFWVLIWISGDHGGWHYVVVDASLRPDNTLPGGGRHPSGQPVPPPPTASNKPTPPTPGTPLPPTAAPKA